MACFIPDLVQSQIITVSNILQKYPDFFNSEMQQLLAMLDQIFVRKSLHTYSEVHLIIEIVRITGEYIVENYPYYQVKKLYQYLENDDLESLIALDFDFKTPQDGQILLNEAFHQEKYRILNYLHNLGFRLNLDDFAEADDLTHNQQCWLGQNY
jgi:hypothetical protein